MVTYYKYDEENKKLMKVSGPLLTNRGLVPTPTKEEWSEVGAYPIGTYSPPIPPQGKVVVVDGYDCVNGMWVAKYRYEDSPSPSPRTFSKLRLYAILSELGKWDELKSWLETQNYNGMNAWAAFSLAQDLSEGNELFEQWVSSAKTALGINDETAKTILEFASLDV